MRCHPKSKKCPECQHAFEYIDARSHPYFPFCSEQCKLLDLGRWLNGEFKIVEDLKNAQSMKDRALDIDDPDVRAALDE
ncbi:hypothetical protein PLCT1_01819 [Planctomycetaceae bacterium]|nr:hypothetical protein PLCT1_01819 [Planctomycetaceae bacterium]